MRPGFPVKTARLNAPGRAIGMTLALCLAGALCLAAEAPTTPSAPPVKCPSGFVCVPEAIYQHQIETASACLAALQECRAKGPGKWGWCAGPSGSILMEPMKLEDGGVSWDWHAGLGASVTWGKRF